MYTLVNGFVSFGPKFENKLEWCLTTVYKVKSIKFNFYRTKPWKKLERDIYKTLIASWIQSVIFKPFGLSSEKLKRMAGHSSRGSGHPGTRMWNIMDLEVPSELSLILSLCAVRKICWNMLNVCYKLLYPECFINLHLILLCSLHVQHVHLILCLNNLSSPLVHFSALPSNTNEGLFWLEVGKVPPSPALKLTNYWYLSLLNHSVVLFPEWKSWNVII